MIKLKRIYISYISIGKKKEINKKTNKEKRNQRKKNNK